VATGENENMNKTFKGYGLAISDSRGRLRDMTAVIAELKEVRDNFSTHAMSEHTLFLQGKLEMLNEVIEYLEYV
jgi:hypothetical protein